MVQERDKISNGSLKVDVVFPQRVIGIDEERLPAIRFADLHPEYDNWNRPAVTSPVRE
jgi:hypothetical protein